MSCSEKELKRLDNTLAKLSELIDEMSNKVKINYEHSLNHIENLNKQLQKENNLLKEQLFAAIANMNNLKNKNHIIYEDLDEIIEELEKLK